MTQITFASAAYLSKKKKTRREQFLEEMDKAIPWDDLLRITVATI
jgi:IS5 family transposase